MFYFRRRRAVFVTSEADSAVAGLGARIVKPYAGFAMFMFDL
jgi:hypothetical protein